MRSHVRAAAVITVALLSMLTVMPAGVSAQCGMMGGGQDHSGMKDKAPKPSGSEKKLRESIGRVLADERGRSILAETLLNDRAFMEMFVGRLTAIPEWRAMASQALASPASGPSGSGAVAPERAAVYACPMHPEVTAPSPGTCSKCGMALVRKEDSRE